MPSLPPPRTTELFYDGQWHNISGDMRESSSVTISRGVTAIGKRADPTVAAATLDNRSGDYSPRNPLSSLYGKIGRNTPWRFSVDAGGPWADLPGGSTDRLVTPDAAALDVTGDLDLSMELAADNWRKPQMLAARYASAAGNNRCWAFELAESGALIFMWSPDGTFASRLDVSSTLPVPAHSGQRMAVRVTLDVNNGSGGRTVRFYTARAINGPWQQLGADLTATGATSVLGGTAPLEIGRGLEFNQLPSGGFLYSLAGRVYGLCLRTGINGPAVVDLAVARAAVGATSWTDATGLVWAVSGAAALTNRHTRMVGEIPAWPPSRDLSGADRTVQIAPAGIMRRLGAGTRPLDSALRRFIIGHTPVECWPLTDGEQATQGSSLFGSPALLSVGESDPEWAKGEVASWIEPTLLCPAQTYGMLQARPNTVGATASWSVDLFMSGAGLSEGLTIYDNGLGSDADPRTSWTFAFIPQLGTIRAFRLVDAADTSSTSFLGDITAPGIFDSRPHHFRLTTVVGGSDTAWVVYLDGVSAASGSASGTGRAVAQVDFEWDLNDSSSSPELSLGYLTCWGATAPAASDVFTAFTGFPGETAGARALRLSEENGIPASLMGLAGDSTALGTQQPQRYLESLDTIAEADLGMMLEQRDALALVYRTRSTLYNQNPTLTLNFANGEISAPFAPIDDDKLTENDVTVRRKNGATSAPAVRTDGPLSVDAIGRYDVAPELSLATDAQTTQQAWWRMHVGTFDGLRYTKITVDLGNSRAYALVNDVLRVDVGDKIRLQDLPADQEPGDVDLIVTGYTEEVGATAWKVVFTCVPGEPWTVGVVEDPVLGRADTEGSALVSAVTSSATTLSVATTRGPLWVTAAPNLLTDPGFESGTGAWVCSRGASIGVVTHEHDVVHSGRGAVRLTRVHPTDAGTLNLTNVSSGWLTVTPGESWTGSAWVYSNGAAVNNMRVAVVTRDSGGVETFAYGSAPAVGKGSWTLLTASTIVPAGAVNVRLAIEGRAAWTVGEWWVADDVRLARTDTLAGPDMADQFPFEVLLGGEVVTVHGISGTSSPQTFYVDRSQNGIVKAQTSGTALSLAHPMRAAL